MCILFKLVSNVRVILQGIYMTSQTNLKPHEWLGDSGNLYDQSILCTHWSLICEIETDFLWRLNIVTPLFDCCHASC